MPTLEQTDLLRKQTQDYVTLGLYEMNEMLRQVAGEEPSALAGLLADLLPEIVDPYAAGIADLNTEFYMNDRAAQGVVSAYKPQELAGVPTRDRLIELARWAAAPLFATPKATTAALGLAAATALVGGTVPAVQNLVATPDPIDAVRSRLAGGVTGLLGNVQRQGTLQLASNDPEPSARWQRVARPGCCAFCAMLASRGAEYTSQAAAEGVVGRGVPVPKNTGFTRRRRGGVGKGIKPRGNQTLGEPYHGHCQCVGVALHAGNRQELHDEADVWFQAYGEARDKTNDQVEHNTTVWQDADGHRHHEYTWVDEAGDEINDKQRRSRMISEMRKILDSK